jgi:hypothetical protein
MLYNRDAFNRNGLLDPEDEDTKILRNVDKDSAVNTAKYPRRLEPL